MARRSKPSAPRKKPSLDFSLTGLTYSFMMLFMGLAAINSGANLLFGVFGLMIGVLLVAGVISRLVLRKLDLRRILPEFLVTQQPGTIHYEFENLKRYWPSMSVTVSELPEKEVFHKQAQAYLLHVAAGTKAQVPLQVTPRCRGLHQLEKFQLSTSFPFGFIKRAVDRKLADSILVYPPIGEVDQRFLQMCISAEQSGARMKPRRGGTDEFYGVKEFRHGENPRWIYWKRSARTGTLVSREMTHVAPPRILIVVDNFVPEPTVQQLAAVERAIAMAASLISRAIDQGLAVGLICWSGQWVSVPPSRGKRHSHELLTILARLPQNDGSQQPAQTPSSVLRRDHLREPNAPVRAPVPMATVDSGARAALTGPTGDQPLELQHSPDDTDTAQAKVADRSSLIDRAREFVRTGATAVVFSPSEIEQGLAEQARGSFLLVAANSAMAKNYFQFAESIDFEQVIPPHIRATARPDS